MKRIPRADQEGVAFPKCKRIKQKPTKATFKEKDLQSAVDDLIDVSSIPNIRLPDEMFRILANSPNSGLKIWAMSRLSGYADNILFMPLCEWKSVKFCIATHIENKTDIGKLHGKQKLMAEEIGYNVCRSLDDAISVINALKSFTKTLKTKLREDVAKI